MSMEEKIRAKLSSIENYPGRGVVAATAFVSLIARAPTERVKLLIQCQGEMLKQGTITRPYNGVIDCTMQNFRNEGLLSFWRGNLTNCTRSFCSLALNVAFSAKVLAVFKQNINDPYKDFSKSVASGSIAGVLSLCFVYPLDYARTRLTNDVKSTKKGGGKRKYNGLVDVYKKTLATDGIAGLYRGFVISCVGVIIYRGYYFGLYNTLKPMLLDPNSGITFPFFIAYYVTVTSGFISYPVDTIQRRMMMTSGEAVKYKGSIDCMLQILRTEGVIAFYKGAGINLLRSIAGAGLLTALDKLVQLYVSIKVDTSDSG